MLIILLVVLIFGARRLPEIGSSLGRSIRSFKSAVTGEDEGKQSKNKGSNSGTPDDRP